MHSFNVIAVAALLLPAVALAQPNDSEPRAKAKAWMVNNFDLVIKGVAVEDGLTYLDVQSSTDSNNDSVLDEGIVRLQCAKGRLEAGHYYVKSPRDTSSGQATGKRTHHPVTFVKEWGASTPQLY